MPVVLERYDNRDRHGDRESIEAILSVDAVVVGTIGSDAKHFFRADTKGLLPMIDGITGTSIDEVWSKIEILVRSRQVRLIKQVTEVTYANSG